MISVKEEQALLALVRCILREEAWPEGAAPPTPASLRDHGLDGLAQCLGLGDGTPGDSPRPSASERMADLPVPASLQGAALHQQMLYPEAWLRPVSRIELGCAREHRERLAAALGERGEGAEIVDDASDDEASVLVRLVERMARAGFVLPLIWFIDAHQLVARLDPAELPALQRSLEERDLVVAMQCLDELLDELAGAEPSQVPLRARLSRPELSELVRLRHRSKAAQRRRELALRPRALGRKLWSRIRG